MSYEEIEEIYLQDQIKQDRKAAQEWAANLLTRHDWLILDTETTGLNIHTAEIIEIALLRPDGSVLLNQRLKPRGAIESGASRTHGITLANLADCPSFSDIYLNLRAVLSDLVVVCYNADYDQPILRNECRRAGLPDIENQWRCAMVKYAEFVGEWSEWHGNYRYQRLPGGDHSAIGDCRATLKLIQKMAAASGI